MSTMPVQLVVSVSCRLPVSVVSGNGDGLVRAEKRAKDPSVTVVSCQCQLSVETATDTLGQRDVPKTHPSTIAGV
jgi:hypothetical protein